MTSKEEKFILKNIKNKDMNNTIKNFASQLKAKQIINKKKLTQVKGGQSDPPPVKPQED